jgi:hypothetical protein
MSRVQGLAVRAYPSSGWLPLQGELLFRGSTFPQVKVDECLVRDAAFLGQVLEVTDRSLIHPDRNLALEPGSIGVLFGF